MSNPVVIERTAKIIITNDAGAHTGTCRFVIYEDGHTRFDNTWDMCAYSPEEVATIIATQAGSWAADLFTAYPAPCILT